MKLIPLVFWMLNLAVDNDAHESFTFPPQFQAQKPGPFSSDKQFYLPVESHSASPYFPTKNFNKLPFPYLPPTVTKMAPGSASPYPLLVSTTLLPVLNKEYEDTDDDVSTTPPQYARNQYNRTQRKVPSPNSERRELRLIGKPFQHPIDRIDTKLPFQFDTNHEMKTQNLGMQSMQPRSIVISDIQRDHNTDQMKAVSFQGPQYLPQSNVFISTTETAIPILRLSNEMDLDGSFSYEALGADQTHYVQHSRMENMGADKEEQVVEGSYSYVGDNGKTYTVHYIADSNGFRASGDHLPVAPPVPEIIQRAVQYNLAEELKKPPHLKSWRDEEKENEVSESQKFHRFVTEPPHLNSLFTGKSPESFSHNFAQPTNSQHNLVAAASSQTPIQTVDFTNQMQNKQNSGTISPQITFTASQGAQIPSVNPPQQPQQNIGRIFTTERPSLPQIVNYEADIKDSDKENNKALWRWQYGINANTNQNMNKNLISRSSGDDDISINFGDMTVDEYSKVIQQQLEPNTVRTPETPHEFEFSSKNEQHSNLQSFSNIENDYQKNINGYSTVNPVTFESYYSTEKITPSTTDWFNNQDAYKQTYKENIEDTQDEIDQTSRPKLITHEQFIPRSQTVTQTYNYDNDFESRRTKILHKNAYDNNYNDLNVLPLNEEKPIQNITAKTNVSKNEHLRYATNEPVSSTTKQILKFSDFIVPEDKTDFKPIFIMPEIQTRATTTTTEYNMENILEDNIFLKNIFTSNKYEQASNNKIDSLISKKLQVKPIEEINTDYPSPKLLDAKPHNEIKIIKKKNLDMADVMNYLSRNQFESNKVRTKPKQLNGNNNYIQKNEMQYFTSNQEPEMENKNTKSYRTLQQHEELRGSIKNYKVLQRNNNFAHTENMDGFRRNISPPTRAVHLPPLGRAGPSLKSYIPPVYD